MPVNIVSQEMLKKLNPMRQPDTLVVQEIRGLAPSFLGADRILILEEIHEPANLGTVLRCAEAFAIKEVLCVMQNACSVVLPVINGGSISSKCVCLGECCSCHIALQDAWGTCDCYHATL